MGTDFFELEMCRLAEDVDKHRRKKTPKTRTRVNASASWSLAVLWTAQLSTKGVT